MATTIRSSLCQRWVGRVIFTQTRHGHRFKTKEKRPKPMERRVFEEITRPMLPSSYILPKSCLDMRIKAAQNQEVNPYEEFLIRHLRKLIESSKTILICHKMPVSNFRLRFIGFDLQEKGLKLSPCNNQHMKLITEGTKLENLAPLLVGCNVLLTSPEVVIKEANDVLKKTPELILLGGFVGDRLVTKDQLAEYSKLPSLDILLGQLCASLNQVGGARTRSLLTSHQQKLATNLEQYRKQLSEEDS